MNADLTLPEIECVRSALLVEDSEDISYLLRHMLEREGFAVHSAFSGRAAESYIKASSPTDIVLTDLMLPYIDGFELITRIREHPLWKDVPIIVLSGKATERDIVRAFEVGANDYVTKPYKPLELLARIRRLAVRNEYAELQV